MTAHDHVHMRVDGRPGDGDYMPLVAEPVSPLTLFFFLSTAHPIRLSQEGKNKTKFKLLQSIFISSTFVIK